MSYFDALTLAAVVDELRATVLGGRIQRVFLPSPLSVGLEVYQNHRRHHLLISAHPRFARVHLSASKLSRGIGVETPLLLLLRKYANGGKIAAIEQPQLERVVLLSIVKRPSPRNLDDRDHSVLPLDHMSASVDEELAEGDEADIYDDTDDENLLRCELVAEIMDQRSNIVLVGDDNSVLASARRITSKMSRRVILPRQPYELPPAQQKRDPRTITAVGAQEAAESAEPDSKGRQPTIARALVGAYRGLSPLAAREAVFRATGDGDLLPTPEIPWEGVAGSVRALWSGRWAPCLAGPHDEPTAFAAYQLTHLRTAEPVSSISAALETYYARREQLTDHQQRRTAIRTQIMSVRDRVERQRAALQSELDHARAADRLRWEGEMIFAYIHNVAPRQSALQVEDEDGKQRTIGLDPAKSAVANAQERFKAYEKAKNASAGVPDRLRKVDLKLAGIDETLALLDLAEGFEAIEAIAAEAAEQELLGIKTSEKRKPKRAKVAPLRLESSDGLPIYVGRSAGQNEMVTFKIGSPEDLWLHVRGLPGAHVLVKNSGRPVPEQTLEEAAALAAYFSRHRAEAAVEVDFARRSQVRRIRGGPPGLVSYHAEGTVRAAPRPPWQ